MDLLHAWYPKTPRSSRLMAEIILIAWNWSMEWAYEQKEIQRYHEVPEVLWPGSRQTSTKEWPKPTFTWETLQSEKVLGQTYAKVWPKVGKAPVVSHQWTNDTFQGEGLVSTLCCNQTFQLWNQSRGNGWWKQWLHSQAAKLHVE